MSEDVITLNDLLDKVRTYISDEKEIEIIIKAYEYAENKYFGEKRLDGSDLITHPLNVALILTNLNADYETIVASLLHETINMNFSTEKELLSLFGENITKLVVSISKINKLSLNVDSDYRIKYYKKIIVGLCEDVRVIYIKLAERLHNMRTLYAIPEHKQKEKAKETLEILAPIAHRLGINNIKSELEDLSLRYYKPEAYFDIVKTLNNTKVERDKSVKEMQESISDLLNANNIKHEIKGRSKSIYSIYKKLEKGRRFKDIYDILALRVFVDNEQTCYLALGIIHSKFKHLPFRFKDFIAMPKQNMYQSLHTTVFGSDNELFEIQIRTYEMDKIAEHGIASHWSYKEKIDGSKSLKNVMDQKLQMFRSLIELNDEDKNNEEFIDNVKREVVDDNIYVFTPNGDVIELPIGSTPIDFAYRVHSGVGEKMVGAIVNGSIVTLDYVLKDGDIVKINVNKNSKGPNREWINIAKTAQARNKIKNYFSRIDKDENIKKGEELLLKDLRKNKLTFSTFLNDKNLEYLYDVFNLDNINDLYHAIGTSKISTINVINTIMKEVKSKEESVLDKMITTNIKTNTGKNDILVEGIDEIKVVIANCCMPVYGDDIIGYISKGKGVTIHRSICHNIASTEERLVKVNWNPNINKKWSANILIYTEKKDNLLLDILAKAITPQINIQNVKTLNHGDYIIYDFIVLTNNKEKLDKFMKDVEQMEYIYRVERVIK